MVRVVKQGFSGKRGKSLLIVFVSRFDKHLVGKTLFVNYFVLG